MPFISTAWRREGLTRYPRVPVPLTDALREMGTPVHQDDACVVDRLEGQRHISASLHDLVVGKVRIGITTTQRQRTRDLTSLRCI
jgi:hypothetical protein